VLLDPFDSPPTADYSQWQADDYFGTYYADAILPDEQRVLDYQIEVLRSADYRFGRALEYGCGPTLHRAIAASRYAFRIDMADWLPDNLAQVRSWLGAPASNPDWRRFTRFILELEDAHTGNTERAVSAARIERREARTRKVVRNLELSDARRRQPLGPAREGFYDLLISGFCIDAVSCEKRIWARCMRNVLSMLEPGGLLILHALYRCRAYRVAQQMFPGADLSRDDVFASLLANGFTRRSIDIQVVGCSEGLEYGYSGILMACGRKSQNASRRGDP